MARIRTIKPEFFTSEDIVSLSPLARLLYIACWCEADREGRMEWKPGTMKLRYFPGDGCQIAELFEELTGRGLVVVYEVGGREYAEIPSFVDHQVINNRESASSIPPRVGHASPTREPRVKAEGKEGRKEGKGGRVVPLNGTSQPEVDGGRREHTGADGRDEDEHTPVASLPLIDGTSFEVSAEKARKWGEAYPAVDVPQQLAAMVVWLDANPKNRKTPGGIERFVVGWLGKAQNRAPRGSGGGGGSPDPWAGAI